MVVVVVVVVEGGVATGVSFVLVTGSRRARLWARFANGGCCGVPGSGKTKRTRRVVSGLRVRFGFNDTSRSRSYRLGNVVPELRPSRVGYVVWNPLPPEIRHFFLNVSASDIVSAPRTVLRTITAKKKELPARIIMGKCKVSPHCC